MRRVLNGATVARSLLSNCSICLALSLMRGRISALLRRLVAFFFFFFSSRRRHTRFKCDWSSDVCSSDLRGRFLSLRNEDFVVAARLDGASEPRIIFRHIAPSFVSHIIAEVSLAIPNMIRSEERRVGKECRSRWSPYH